MADQRSGVDTGQLFFTNGEGYNRDVFGGHALVTQFAVEGHVGVAVDGGDHGSLLASAAEAFDFSNDVLPVSMAERGVVDHDVFFSHTVGLQIGFQNAVGGARVDVVGTGQNPALNADFILEVVNRRNGLLVRRSAGVEHVAGRLFAFVLNRVEQDAVQFFNDGQNRFTRNGSPAAEDGVHAVLFQQFTGTFGEQRPVGGRVNDNGFELFTEQAAFLVLLFDQHQHGVFQGGFRDSHGAGQRMQHADLDGFLGLCAECAKGHAAGDAECADLFDDLLQSHVPFLSLLLSEILAVA